MRLKFLSQVLKKSFSKLGKLASEGKQLQVMRAAEFDENEGSWYELK